MLRLTIFDRIEFVYKADELHTQTLGKLSLKFPLC